MKKVLKILLTIILLAVLSFGLYIAYIEVNYFRIEDNKDLTKEIRNNQTNELQLNKEYSIITNNIGFGAYNHDFSFFMDSGIMKDGTEVAGKYSKAINKNNVLDNINHALEVLEEYNPDLIFLQEVDVDSTRSFYINQKELIENALKEYSSIFDYNMHTSYLILPITDPHGFANAGLLSLSKYNMKSAIHKKLPIDESFFLKFTDLDRCMTIIRIKVENDKELVLIHAHLSAYDKGGIIRKKQLNTLLSIMNEEYKKGNYVIVGGDFNHILSDDYKVLPSNQERPHWIFTFPEDELSSYFSIVHSENVNEVGSCRSTDISYEKGVNYEAVIDGFIVSDNIEAVSKIIDTDYIYSDHNPVIMKFKLKE